MRLEPFNNKILQTRIKIDEARIMSKSSVTFHIVANNETMIIDRTL